MCVTLQPTSPAKMGNDASEKKSKILVVDDVPINVEVLRRYLVAAGFEVTVAFDGEEALEKVAQEQPDLILLDIMLPKLNGYEVCRRLKNDERTRFIPIVMITALKEVEDKIKGIEAGSDDFISKPFNRMELMARVQSLLRIKYLHDALENKVAQLQEARERLQRLAITDGLTGLYNYRYFREQLSREISRAERHNLKLSVIMIDIDFFKHYNDHHGHPAGDDILQNIAMLLKKNIRKIDIAARYGGEEFSLILIETDKKFARFVAEKIRILVEEYPFQFEEGQPDGKLTISMGLSTYPDDGLTPKELIDIADQRLYQAKQSGRNKVVAN